MHSVVDTIKPIEPTVAPAPPDARAAVAHGAVVGALTARLDVRRAKARRRAADRLAAMTDGKGERMFRRLLEA